MGHCSFPWLLLVAFLLAFVGLDSSPHILFLGVPFLVCLFLSARNC